MQHANSGTVPLCHGFAGPVGRNVGTGRVGGWAPGRQGSVTRVPRSWRRAGRGSPVRFRGRCSGRHRGEGDSNSLGGYLPYRLQKSSVRGQPACGPVLASVRVHALTGGYASSGVGWRIAKLEPYTI